MCVWWCWVDDNKAIVWSTRVLELLQMRLLILSLLMVPFVWAESAEDAIRAVMARQTADWNRGDVRAFMRGYDNSDATMFIGSNVERGYQRVLDRFVARYPTKDKM